MNEERIALEGLGAKARLTAFWPENAETGLPAVLVLPGGAYIACAENEGAPVARAFAERGYRAYVLEYSTLFGAFDRVGAEKPDPAAVFPAQPLELGRAMAYIRQRGGGKIVLCGLSAGGHLAAWHGSVWQAGEIAGALGLEAEALRPAGQILCYPALELRGKTGDMARLMRLAVCGTENPTPEQLREKSPLALVSGSVPPTFLWHCAGDPMVPARESLEMAAALLSAGVLCEAHLFPRGGHATGVSRGMHCGQWVELADRWMRRYAAKP